MLKAIFEFSQSSFGAYVIVVSLFVGVIGLVLKRFTDNKKCIIICVLAEAIVVAVPMLIEHYFPYTGRDDTHETSVSISYTMPISAPTATPYTPPKTETKSISSYKGFYSASASSYFPNNIFPVSPDKAVDGKSDTSWDSYGQYAGAWIEIRVNDGIEYRFNGFSIRNGKAPNVERYGNQNLYYDKNARVKECKIEIDGVQVWRGTLDDTNSLRYYYFGKDYIGSRMRLTVISVYPGNNTDSSKYGVCITELQPV